MTNLIVEHNVQDYAIWRPVFDNHSHLRDKYGLTNVRVYRGAEDPNRVCVIGEAPNAGNVEAFINDPSLKQAMQESGVVGEPTITILEAPATTTI